MEYKYPYKSKEALETIKHIIGKRNSFFTNKLYRCASGANYYYYNQKSYLHVVIPCHVREHCGEEIAEYYEINDYLLTQDGTMKLKKTYGYFPTREKCIAKIEERLACDDSVCPDNITSKNSDVMNEKGEINHV